MEKKLIFDSDWENYDKWRPRYCKKLFDDILTYSKIDKDSVTVEIGSGTGQATEPILETGCKFIAVETGFNFCCHLKSKYAHYKKFSVENIEFEKFIIDDNSVDLVYAATAFHWIPEEIGYKKVYNILKTGGTLALFWNRPFVNRKDDPLHQKIQNIYDYYRPEQANKPKIDIEHDKKRYKSITSLIQQGFKDFQYNIYKQTRSFTADKYIYLLNTYSDHKSLKASIKYEFENEIKKAIIDSGGILKIYDDMDLYLAKK